MTDEQFALMYTRALSYSRMGATDKLVALCQRAAEQGANEAALSMLGALAERAFQSPIRGRS